MTTRQLHLSNEQLEELVTLGAAALTMLPEVTTNFNVELKTRVIRAREKYRRLSFELAGDLAKEVLQFRALVDISRSGSVSTETVKE